jgi:hypothetical protein
LKHYDIALLTQPEDRFLLANKASLLATCPEARFRDGAIAVKLAEKAYRSKMALEHEKWQFAIALAEAHAEVGNFDQAVRYATIALQKAGPESGRRQEFMEKLSLFEKKMPYRGKW